MVLHRSTDSLSQELEVEQPMERKLSGRKKPSSKRSGSLAKIIVLIALAILTGVGLRHVGAGRVKAVAIWLDSHRSGGGIAIFCALCTLGVVVLIPGPLMAVISGALYGKVFGSLLVWVSCTFGQSITYFLGRFLLREWVVDWASRYMTKFQIIDTVIGKEGWKFVLLLRLSPLIPDSLLNYVLSATSINYLCYQWSSSLAILPWSVVFAYLGSIAQDVADAAEGEVHMTTRGMVSSVILSISSMCVLGWYTARVSRRALSEACDERNLTVHKV